MQRTNPEKRALLLFFAAILIASTASPIMAIPDAFSGDFAWNSDCATSSGSLFGSCNNSSIALFSQQEINSSPVDLSIGSGYYSDHPMAVSLGSGSRTVIANGDSATSMSHDVSFAQAVSGNSGYSVSSSFIQDPIGRSSSTSTGMQIDEAVTNGRVNIGVLAGANMPGQMDKGGVDPMTSAWKNPAIEIEEEYIGTYHISKNFSINSSQSSKRTMIGWFDCCNQNYLILPSNQPFLSADDVFNSSAMKAVH
jgi:hypothetical protein